MKAVVLVLACVAVAAALSVKSSPEARFMSTEEGLSSGMSAATVVSDRDYAALKHEEAEKAVRALHLPGDKPDLLADLGIDHNTDAEEQANDEELLALAAQTESTESEDADAAETAAALESEIEAVEAEEDSADVLLEVAEEEEDEEEAEDEAEAEAEEEAEEEDSAEEEDAVFLEVADEEADEDEDESEEESEDEAEAEEEAEEEESESEDLALIAESEEKPSAYISPVLRPALPSKHNDAMPDATYDKVAETNLFPPAAHLVGAGPKPKPFSPAEIAAADAKIRAARAKKAKAKKLARKSKKAMKAPRPAAAGKKARKSRKSRKAARKSRKARKNRKAARKTRRGSRKGRKARKSRRGSRKSRRGSRKGRKARRGSRKGRRGGRKASKKSKKCKKPGDPRCIITAPYLQDIRDARHKHFVKTTNDLLNEVDDGILEHMVYPPIADPNKKGCKTKKAKKF